MKLQNVLAFIFVIVSLTAVLGCGGMKTHQGGGTYWEPNDITGNDLYKTGRLGLLEWECCREEKVPFGPVWALSGIALN